MMYHQYRPGYVEVISGCMFAGKTEELIRRIKVLEFAKKKVLVFKPAIDNRYSETKVVSHAGSILLFFPQTYTRKSLRHIPGGKIGRAHV